MYAPIPQEVPETDLPHQTLLLDGPEALPFPAQQKGFWERWLRGHYTIVPESNAFMDVWDVLIILALAATAVVLPYEVALITTPPLPLLMLDTVIDCVFTVDIVVTFNVAYAVTNLRSTETYQREPLKIARHYMAFPFSENLSAGWFWPDVATVIPWELVTGNRDANSVRLVRVLRLVRMLRLVRVVKLFKRWHTHLGFSFALVKVMKCLTITLLITHWLACVWGHVGMHAEDYQLGHRSWLSRTPLAHTKDVSDFTSLEIYQLALYFCAVVLTTVGFGDIVPMNQVEVMMMTATIFLTGVTWTLFVANIVDVIGNVDIYSLHFNHAMDDLNSMMESHHVTYELKRRIRRHLHEAYHVHRARHHQDVVSWLSEGLQGELAVECGVEETCSCIWYFRNVGKSDWMIDLAQHFKAEMYSPGEFVAQKRSVMVIRKGSCVRKGIVLLRDSVIGEDMILVSDFLRDTSVPRTINICEVMMLSRQGLVTVCERHKELNQRIRKAQIKLAVWRAFIFLAHKIRRFRKKNTWDSYFNADTAGEEHVKKRFWGAMGKLQRPGWLETLAAKPAAAFQKAVPNGGTGTILLGGTGGSLPGLPSDRTRTKSKELAECDGEVLRELRSMRESLEEHQAAAAGRLEALCLRMEAMEQRRHSAPTLETPAPVLLPSEGSPSASRKLKSWMSR